MPDQGLLALALGAGLLAAVNPCGFALLPAYFSLLVLGDDQPTPQRAVARALRLTAAMTLGFAGVFAVFGLAIAPAASGIQEQLPWVTLLVGLLLTGLGVWLLAGRTVTMPRRRGSTGAARPLTGTTRSMVGFGAAYALASLTCTIAPFLAVVVATFQNGSVTSGVVLFLAYAAGMGVVVGTVAVAVALAQDTVVNRVRSAGRWAPRVGGVLLLVCGAYVAYYGAWEIRVNRGGGLNDPVIDAAARLQDAVSRAVGAPGVGGWALVGLALVLLTLAPRLARRVGARADSGTR